MSSNEIDQLQDVVNALVLANGNKTQAAVDMDMARTTYRDALERAERLGVRPTVFPPDQEAMMAEIEYRHSAEVSELKRQLKTVTQEAVNIDTLREHFFQLTTKEASPPDWIVDTQTESSTTGIPMVLASDWHWGEVVDPTQIDNINAFNVEIAEQRWRKFIEKVIDLAFNHTVNPDYPGIIFALGGDMVSGDIHEELAIANDGHPIEHVFQFFDVLVWAIDTLADKFGKVFVPCAYGNHGRLTKGYRFKDAAVTNFDWQLYTMLERHYAAKGDKRVTFMIPRSFDSYFKVNNTHFVLTHGDRLGVRGGDGVIGLVGPVTRGVKKLKATYASLKKPVDYVLMGHWHQAFWLRDAIVNGSGKGYDEYSAGGRFEPEAPVQLMWWVHPKYGISFKADLYLDKIDAPETPNWVEVPS